MGRSMKNIENYCPEGCWVRVASSTWSTLWLRNTNRERLQKNKLFQKQLESSPTISINSEGKEETLECVKSW